jgi:hypothetical protein
MGTRSLTFVYEESKSGEKPEAIINMYRQFDGYPTGHGAELAEFLNSGRVVNGLALTKTAEEFVFNGMGCLAASLIANFKQSPGGFYIHPVSQVDCGQDYEYHIYNIDGEFKIEVYYCGCNMFGMSGDPEDVEVVFSGTLTEFTEFCKEKETA